MIVMHTNHGRIVLELDPEKAPLSAANFEQYARDGFYGGTIFHRIIGGFMIQGGGFEPGMHQKRTHPAIQNEANNGLKNVKGTIAMARTGDPHSATSQFFINISDNAFLDYPGQDGWGYCVFGKVVEGMDVVNAIKSVATTSRAGHQDVPVEDVVIERVEVTESSNE